MNDLLIAIGAYTLLIVFVGVVILFTTGHKKHLLAKKIVVFTIIGLTILLGILHATGIIA